MASSLEALAIFSTFLVFCSGHPVRYDQRQEGDLNVRADVEDVVLVVVPPKDIISAGLSVAAATAANLLKKSYAGMEADTWLQKTSLKTGFASVDKAPYKIDLGGKPETHTKRFHQHRDPNRYNHQGGRIPVRSASNKPPKTDAETHFRKNATGTISVTDKQFEPSPADENKTVKKDLKKEEAEEEEMKKASEEKNSAGKAWETVKVANEEGETSKAETETEKNANALKTEGEKVAAEKDSSKTETVGKESEKSGGKTEVERVPGKNDPPKAEAEEKVSPKTEDVPRVIGELSEGELGPTSIFSHEGCGPDAYRDLRGICVYKKRS